MDIHRSCSLLLVWFPLASPVLWKLKSCLKSCSGELWIWVYPDILVRSTHHWLLHHFLDCGPRGRVNDFGANLQFNNSVANIMNLRMRCALHIADNNTTLVWSESNDIVTRRRGKDSIPWQGGVMERKNCGGSSSRCEIYEEPGLGPKCHKSVEVCFHQIVNHTMMEPNTGKTSKPQLSILFSSWRN